MSTKFVQAQPFQLAGSGSAIGDTTLIVLAFNDPDGNALAMTDFGSKGFGTLEPGSSNQEEQISWTGVTQNGDGTATLTGVKSVLFKTPYTESSLAKTHAGGTSMVITNTAQFYDNLVEYNNDETITGIWTFTNPNVPRMDADHTYVGGDTKYFATKKYVDDTVSYGAPLAATDIAGIIEIATEAESLTGTDTGATGALLGVLPSQIAKNVQNTVYNYAADAGSTDAYAITIVPAISAYATGQVFTFKANTINTGDATLNVNAKGAKNILKNHDQTLEDGDIETGMFVTVVYDGTQFQMVNQQATMPTTALLTEMAGFFAATDITGAEAETLSSGATSNADALHTHTVLNKLIGVGLPAKTFWNFTIPYVIGSSPATGVYWEAINIIVASNHGLSHFTQVAAGGGPVSLLTVNPIFPGITFGSGKDVFVEFGVLAAGLGTNKLGWGLSSSNAAFIDDDDQTVDAACFTVATNGKLYSHTSNAVVGHTENEITGITLTNMNTFRIEFNGGVNAKFYVNGVLKSTHTTNLPGSGEIIRFGFGSSSNTSTVTYITAPNIAVEK